MTSVTIGDMARHFMLRRQNTDLQARLATLSKELTTGKKADVAGAVSGDFKVLAGLDHRLGILDGYKTATSEAGFFAENLQHVLGTVASIAGDTGPTLLGAGTTGGVQSVTITTGDARQKFSSVVSALNTQVADRFLLSGAATDRAPISGATDIMNALSAATAGQTTASGIITTVDSWFDAPPGGGGFADAIYGGAGQPGTFATGPNDEVTLDVTAVDPAIIDALKGLALASLVSGGALAGDDTGRAFLTRTAGETLQAAGSDLALLRGRVGSVEARIADSETRNAAETTALTIARAQIVEADPYETATTLEGTQTQIETLYSITARLSRLTLADFLR